MREIFPLVQDDSLERVPPDFSAERMIQKVWQGIRKRILDGVPHDQELRNIEDYLVRREGEIKTGALSSKFDWKYDFSLAHFIHNYNLTLIPMHNKSRELSVVRWQQTTDKITEFVLNVASSGFKTILIVHGAAAVGAINVLIQSPPKTGAILLASKIVLISAVLGIIMVGIGQLIFINVMSKAVGKLRHRLAGNPSWLRLRAMQLYFSKTNNRSKWGDRLIYGSVFWFCLYSLLATVILIISI